MESLDGDLFGRFLLGTATKEEVRTLVRHLLREHVADSPSQRTAGKSPRRHASGGSAFVLGFTTTPRPMRSGRPPGPGSRPPFFQEKQVRRREASGWRGDDSGKSVSQPADSG